MTSSPRRRSKGRTVRFGQGAAVVAAAVMLAACSSDNSTALETNDETLVREVAESSTTTEPSATEPEIAEAAEEATEAEEVEEATEAEAAEVIPPSETFGSGTALDTPTADADKVVEINVANGDVEIAELRVEVEAGSTVGVVVEADEVEHLHLHGYDILVDLVPGEPANFSFLADQSGVFEVELEESGLFLFEVQVN